MSLHYHYDSLTIHDRNFVDDLVRTILDFRREEKDIGENPPSLACDDRCERAVDALSRWVIESNPEMYPDVIVK